MLRRASIFTVCMMWAIVPHAAQADPSFDCHTNWGVAEQTICANPDIASLDTQMSDLYFSISNDSTGRYYRRLKRDQRAWLRDRDDCGANVRCLRMIYRARIQELSDILHTGD